MIYTHKNKEAISFPLGGIGSGCIGLVVLSQEVTRTAIKLKEGTLRLNALKLPFAANVTGVTIDGNPQAFTFAGGTVTFVETTVMKSIEIFYQA